MFLENRPEESSVREKRYQWIINVLLVVSLVANRVLKNATTGDPNLPHPWFIGVRFNTLLTAC